MSQNPNPSLLDPGQIVKRSFDESADRIRVDIGSAISIDGDLLVDINQADDSVLAYGQDNTSTNRALRTDSDGRLVVVTSTSAPGTPATVYNEISAVTSGSETSVVSYTVPISSTSTLKEISASGENIATYTLKVNGTAKQKLRSYFGGSLNVSFTFPDGLNLSSGDVVLLTVIHNRPSTADFNGSIKVVEV